MDDFVQDDDDEEQTKGHQLCEAFPCCQIRKEILCYFEVKKEHSSAINRMYIWLQTTCPLLQICSQALGTGYQVRHLCSVTRKQHKSLQLC